MAEGLVEVAYNECPRVWIFDHYSGVNELDRNLQNYLQYSGRCSAPHLLWSLSQKFDSDLLCKGPVINC